MIAEMVKLYEFEMTSTMTRKRGAKKRRGKR
jgi:hypothetical protein